MILDPEGGLGDVSLLRATEEDHDSGAALEGQSESQGTVEEEVVRPRGGGFVLTPSNDERVGHALDCLRSMSEGRGRVGEPRD